ncbi:hypothetical protein ACFX14_009013 [Malus domestica]
MRKYWDVVGKDIVDMVKAFWFSGKLLRKLNHTHLVLILKIYSPRSMSQLRRYPYKDNILVVHEILHSLNQQCDGDEVFVAMKLDMAKAYDRVEWTFLLAMMEAMGFPTKFCHRIVECITTAMKEEVQEVMDVLQCYAETFGQAINRENSSLYFGANCSRKQHKRLAICTNIKGREDFGKYLGINADFGSFKKAVFEGVREALEGIIKGWAKQFLSPAGKEVFIKAVAITLPNYAMSYFKLLVGLSCQCSKRIEDGCCEARNGASFAGQLVRWNRPPYGVLKINCDGAWCGKTRKGGYGWVVRDFAGLLQTASGEGGLFFNTEAMAEAAAIRVALLVCIELECEEVEVESDSQVIIQMLNGEYVINATLECFIHAIGLLVSQLGRVKFVFFKWNGSAAAHAVASYVASHRGAFRWNAFGPEFLFNILTKDINVSIRI